MVLGGETSGKCLSHEGGTLMSGISALLETTERSLAFYMMWGYNEKYTSWRGPSPNHSGILILNF